MTKNLVRNGALYLYGPVGGCFLDEPGFTDEDVVSALEGLSGDITVHVNSPGGNAFQSIAIHTALTDYDGSVTIQVDALAASAASVIACAADILVMTPGAQIMIHDPSNITFGDAEAHRRTAAQLESISKSAAKIYAQKSGLTEVECLSMMASETWLDADEAMNKGFADKITGREENSKAAEMQFPAFDYSIFSHAPEAVMSASVSLDIKRRGNSVPVKPVAPATLKEEPSMVKPNNPEPSNVVAPATPRMNIDEFMTLSEKHNLSAAQMRSIKKKARPADAADNEADPLDPVMVRDEILALKEKGQPDPINNHPAVVTMDAIDKFKQGAVLGLQRRLNKSDGEQNEFAGMSLLRLAEESLRLSNVKVPHARDKLALTALTGGPSMSHTVSDFPSILADVAHKSLLKGHSEVEETFEKFTSTGTLTDFKPTSRVDLSTIPGLDSVAENGEYKDVTLGDRKETIRLKKYGNKISLTWETLVNDDLDVLGKIPQKMGRAAKRTVGDVVFSIFTDNPAMADGTALFHAGHSNLFSGGTSAFSASSLSKLRQLMALQKDGEAVLNIKPSFLLVPVALEDDATVLIASEFAPGETQRVPNKVRNMVREVIADARLDALSAKSFFTVADPSMFDTIEVAYLDGMVEPQMFQREGFDRDGIDLKIRHVFGVAPLSSRTMAKSAGE